MRRNYRREGLWKRYGLTLEGFEELKRKQKGKCMICGRETSGGVLNVDHQKGTKRVRGLLCWSCNVGLGHFEHDPRRLRRAAAYLAAFETGHPDPHELLLNLRRMGGY